VVLRSIILAGILVGGFFLPEKDLQLVTGIRIYTKISNAETFSGWLYTLDQEASDDRLIVTLIHPDFVNRWAVGQEVGVLHYHVVGEHSHMKSVLYMLTEKKKDTITLVRIRR
jgi:hypothetical protein